MNEQFMPYEMAFKFKELGFDERCFAYFNDKKEFNLHTNPNAFYTRNSHVEKWCTTIWARKKNKLQACQTPLWQQAYEWLFKKLEFYYPYLEVNIFTDYSGDWHQSYDALTGNVEVNIEFNNKREMFETMLQLFIDGKSHKYYERKTN